MNAELPLSPEDVADIVSILDRTPYDRFDIRSDRFSLAVIRAGEGWVQSWEFAAPPTEAAGQPSAGPDGNRLGSLIQMLEWAGQYLP